MSTTKYFNKELSWLSFNERVLMEAKDLSNPLYERIKFLSIYASNLDEFFRIDVGKLKKLMKVGSEAKAYLTKSPKKILIAIHNEVKKQYADFQKIFFEEVQEELNENCIYLYAGEELDRENKLQLTNYFKSRVLTFIYTQKLSKNNEVDMENIPYFLVRLKKDIEEYAIVNIPSNKLPRFYELATKGEFTYVFLDDIIKEHMQCLFEGYEILEVVSFRLVKDESIDIEDEYAGNLIEKIKHQLNQGRDGFTTNLTYDQSISEASLLFLKKYFSVKNSDLLANGKYQNLQDLIQLPNPRSKELELPKKRPIGYKPFDERVSIFKAISKQDHLLHYPYHSYNNVLRFMNEASIDCKVKEIKITLYRIAENSGIANALISAAKNGKKVVVFVEVKARTDEANNLYWAEQMEKVGIKIIYSIPALKVHAKLALVMREEEKGDYKGYAYLSTGNFNEYTAKIYSDIGHFTSRKKVVEDVNQVFDYLHKKQSIARLNELLVTRRNLKKRLLKLIDNEIEHKKGGREAAIILKVNNLEQQDMIDKLYEAAEAGVKLTLIVRSICCFKPQKHFKNRVKIIRIVDSYLEHARIFYFHNNGKEKIYLSSADWMQKNIHHRIEVAFPIVKKSLKNFIKHLLDLQVRDNVKGVEIDANLKNRKKSRKENRVRSQVDTYAFINTMNFTAKPYVSSRN